MAAQPARQTPGAALFQAGPSKAALKEAGFEPSDFEEAFGRSSGPGGQNVNKVSTAVTVRHLATGLAATAQDSRSQATNRGLAWARLLAKLAEREREASARRRQERERERRRKRRRPRGLKERILESKRRRGEIKRLRREV